MTDPTDQDLQTLWQAAEANSPVPTRSQIEARARRFRSRLLRRNGFEYISCGFAICVCLGLAFILPPPLCKLGAVLVCAACAFIAAVLARRGHPRQADAGEDCVAFYIGELRRQRDLMQWAWLWYIAPMVPGMFLIMLGEALRVPQGRQAIAYPAFAATAVVTAAIFGWVIWLNLHTARRLERTIRSLSSPAPEERG
jgi:hypothetical protein